MIRLPAVSQRLANQYEEAATDPTADSFFRFRWAIHLSQRRVDCRGDIGHGVDECAVEIEEHDVRSTDHADSPTVAKAEAAAPAHILACCKIEPMNTNPIATAQPKNHIRGSLPKIGARTPNATAEIVIAT